MIVHVACEIAVNAETDEEGEENVRDILGALIGIGDIKAAFVSGAVDTPLEPYEDAPMLPQSPAFAEAVSMDGEPIRLDEDTLAIEAG